MNEHLGRQHVLRRVRIEVTASVERVAMLEPRDVVAGVFGRDERNFRRVRKFGKGRVARAQVLGDRRKSFGALFTAWKRARETRRVLVRNRALFGIRQRFTELRGVGRRSFDVSGDSRKPHERAEGRGASIVEREGAQVEHGCPARIAESLLVDATDLFVGCHPRFVVVLVGRTLTKPARDLLPVVFVLREPSRLAFCERGPRAERHCEKCDRLLRRAPRDVVETRVFGLLRAKLTRRRALEQTSKRRNAGRAALGQRPLPDDLPLFLGSHAS